MKNKEFGVKYPLKQIRSMIKFIIKYWKYLLGCMVATLIFVILVGGTVLLEFHKPAPRTFNIQSFKGEVKSHGETDMWHMNLVNYIVTPDEAMEWGPGSILIYNRGSIAGEYIEFYRAYPNIPGIFQHAIQKFTWPALWTTSQIDYDQQRKNLYIYPGLYDVWWFIVAIGGLVCIVSIITIIQNLIEKIKINQSI